MQQRYNGERGEHDSNFFKGLAYLASAATSSASRLGIVGFRGLTTGAGWRSEEERDEEG